MPSVSDAPRETRGINWVALIFIVSYHLALLVGMPLYLLSNTPSWSLIGWTAFLLVSTLLAITAGYHRLYAHRTYRTRKVVEGIMVFFGTLATQGSVIRWAHDHRIHHSHLDTEEDPYDTPKGFWHSHVLWMFKKNKPIDERYVKDLLKNKLLVFQHRHYGVLMTVTNALVVLGIGWLTGDFFGALVFAFLLRLFLAHHSTWFINSLAHMWGTKPYSTEHSAVNNFILALLTYGEGYHNYHHTFATDYRNGVRWYQFDPPKYLIWLLEKVGLASDLKRTDRLIIKKQLVQADRKLLLDHLNNLPEEESSAFRQAVEKMSDKLSETIVSAKTVMDRYRSVDRTEDPSEWEELRERFRTLRQEIQHDLKTWRRLCRLVLDLEPVRARG